MAHPPMLAVNERFVAVHGHGRQHSKEAGSGEPLILIHTNGASAWQYAEVFPLLLTRFHVLAWDMPGHGDSDPIQRHYSVEDYADALSSLASLRPQVDAFLDGVLVNSPKAEERANRLRLLAGVRDLMGRAADFSLVTG